MHPKKSNLQLTLRYPDLVNQLDPQNHYLGLSMVILWKKFEDSYRPFYTESPPLGKPIRLMSSLLILKQLKNLNAERVAEILFLNLYFQALCGQLQFSWKLPCDTSELAHIRCCIGKVKIRKLLEVFRADRGDKSKETAVVVDSIVRGKNITFPMDAKLLTKTLTIDHSMAKLKDVKLRYSFQPEMKSLKRTIRFKFIGCRQDESQRAARRLRSIDGILIRDLKLKLSPETLNTHQLLTDLYDRAPRHQCSDNIYSLHKLGVSCISNDKTNKEHKSHAKTSVALTKTNGFIVGAQSFHGYPFDGHSLPATQSQVEDIVGQTPSMAISDRGHRGKSNLGVTNIKIPDSGEQAKTTSNKRQIRERFRYRATIKPVIGHIKMDQNCIAITSNGRATIL